MFPFPCKSHQAANLNDETSSPSSHVNSEGEGGLQREVTGQIEDRGGGNAFWK